VSRVQLSHEKSEIFRLEKKVALYANICNVPVAIDTIPYLIILVFKPFVI
jgi:hypothetical protein